MAFSHEHKLEYSKIVKNSIKYLYLTHAIDCHRRAIIVLNKLLEKLAKQTITNFDYVDGYTRKAIKATKAAGLTIRPIKSLALDDTIYQDVSDELLDRVALYRNQVKNAINAYVETLSAPIDHRFTTLSTGGRSPFDEERYLLEQTENEGPEEILEQKQLDETLYLALSRLTEDEQFVIHHRFVCDHTLEETGQLKNVTRERIRQIEAKALRKLRHPRSAHELLILMGTITNNEIQVKVAKDYEEELRKEAAAQARVNFLPASTKIASERKMTVAELEAEERELIQAIRDKDKSHIKRLLLQYA